MAHIAFKIMMMMVLFNVSCGVVINMFPQTRGTSPQALTYINGLGYNETQADKLKNSMDGDLHPSPKSTDPSGIINYVLNVITMGVYDRIWLFFQEYLFGAITLLDHLFGGMLDQSTRDLYFRNPGIFYVIMGIVYTTAGYYLWTGRNLAG